MKKKLYIALGIVAGLLLAAYLVVIFFLGSLVTRAVNHYGPQIAGTAVTLTAAHISPFSGEGTLDSLKVANPQGWSANQAFALKRIHISVVPRSLLSDHVIINDIDIEDPEFLYETKILSSNIGDLVKNIEGQKSNPSAQAKSSNGAEKRFEIHHLIIRGGKLTISVMGRAPIPLTMPTVEFHDLGNGQGVTSTELAALVGETILKSILEASTKALGKTGGAAAGAAGDILKGLFNH